jgi:hypothetical protein
VGPMGGIFVTAPPTQREIAAEILEALLAKDDRIEIQKAVAVAARRGVSRRTLTRAARQLELNAVLNGPAGSFWER